MRNVGGTTQMMFVHNQMPKHAKWRWMLSTIAISDAMVTSQ